MGRGYQAGVSRVRYDFPACAFPTLFGILVEGISMDAGIPGLFRHHSRAMGFGVQFHRTPDSCPHPRTPRGGHRFVERNLQLERAAEFSAAAALRGELVVLMGDLNCTPFSPWFDRLLTRGLLRDSAVGLSLKPTWSSGPWWLPLDHILLGGKWEVRERRVYEDRLGSDHFPVMATLGFSEIPGRTREKYSTNL